jgi:dTDP-4-amino-4,6-dideoxygalactose transaminase
LSCFLIDPKEFGNDRDAVIRALDRDDVESRPLWKPLHLQPLYAGAERFGGEVSEEIFRKGICLPSSSVLGPADLERVVALVRGACSAMA